MQALYKSSKTQTYSYYIIYPIIICIILYFTYKIVAYGSFSFFILIIVLIFLYALIEATESLYSLRYIEVFENSISVSTLKGRKTIEFKDVMYVYNLINFKGTYLIIWYKDIEAQKPKVILARPETEKNIPEINLSLYLKGGGELGITKFIKEKAIKENPNYIKTGNPRWFMFSIIPTF